MTFYPLLRIDDQAAWGFLGYLAEKRDALMLVFRGAIPAARHSKTVTC